MLHSWGCNVNGALGRGALGGFDNALARVPAIAEPVVSIAAGWGHSVAVTASGDALVFGRAIDGRNALRFGQLAARSPWVASVWTRRFGGHWSIDFPQPSLASRGAESARASFAFSLFQKQGELFALGQNRHGQTGCGDADEEVFNVRKVRIDKPVVSYAAGFQHCAAVDVEGGLWTWGNGARGQTGRFRATSQPDAAPFRVLQGASMVGCGLGHASCVMRDGSVLIWGKRQGVGGADAIDPVPVGIAATQLWCGQHHTVVVGDDGALWQFGQPPNELTMRTMRVEGLPRGVDVADVAAGWLGESVAVTRSGEAFRWDWDSPAKPLWAGVRVRKVSLGWRHRLAIVQDVTRGRA